MFDVPRLLAGRCPLLNTPTLLLVAGLVLVAASPSRGEVGAIVLEPVDALGFFTRVGHAGTYFSNICPDGSSVKMRLCRPGEHGAVVSKYSPLSEYEDYDWAIVPFDEFMHGFGASELAPLIGTHGLQRVIEQHKFGPLFSSALRHNAMGAPPDGQWKAALATRFDRSIYIYSVETTAADDAALVAAFNAAPNKSRFNFFYRNCSDQARRIFDLILPDIELIGDRTDGVTMETPKGLAKALVARALEDPALHLRVRRYPQIPGTFRRSRDVLFPMENSYKSIAFAPWWWFSGFRYAALGAMLYHEVISPFDMLQSSRDFISAEARELTLEQHRLRRQQDDVRQALTVAQSRGRGWSPLADLDGRVVRRLAEIENAKRAEVRRVEGSKARWRELDRGFQSMIPSLSRQPFVPATLKRHLVRFEPGTLSETLLRYFEANGSFYIDEAGGGPWIRLPLVDGEMASTGLSTSQILAGDSRLAVMVLAAVLDYNLYQTDARREDIDYVEGIFRLFSQATEAIRRQPAGEW
jgi:hypothetical protein